MAGGGAASLRLDGQFSAHKVGLFAVSLAPHSGIRIGTMN
jgi:hypothetical protein